MYNLEYSENSYNLLIWEMIEFLKLLSFQNFAIWKIHISKFKKLNLGV